MKKLFVLSFASIFLLTGCGATETLSCEYRDTTDQMTTRIHYDIDHQDEEIKKVRITYNYDFTNNDNGNNGTARNATTYNNGTNGDTNGTNRDAVMNDNGTTENNTTGNTNTGNGTAGDTTMNNTGTTRNTTTNNGGTTTHTDGVGTGTDGTTSDTNIDDDGIVDGVVGSVIDTIVGGVTGVILDSAGLRDRHNNVQNTYGNVNGFSVQNTNDTNNNYRVTYVIDYDTITDADLARFNLSRDFNSLRTTYVNQGFTCK